MNTFLCSVAMLILAQPDYSDRKPHPFAPSLPRLTKEESKKFDEVIENFIQWDIGKLKGDAGKKAVEDFSKLPPESIFNLIGGLNRAANMESSCPAVLIAKKVNSILSASDDLDLLKFAQQNIGADVTAKRHLGVLQDLQFNILLRKGALQRRALAEKRAGGGGPKSITAMSLAELEKSLSKASGPALKAILTETEKRQGTKAVELLIAGISNADAEISKLSQALLAKNMQRQSSEVLKAMLKHDRTDVRIAAANAVGKKKLRLGAELIALLQDGSDDAREAAHRALVQIAGTDLGTNADRWREWWSKQK